MATTGKKEYTLKINGVDTAVKDFTTLEAAVKSFDSALEKDRAVISASTKATKEKAKALTEEEKAAKKLEETQKKIKAAQEGANDAQLKANQALREATREQGLRIRAEQASTNSIEAMRVKLSQLKDDWKGLDVGTEEFQNMSEEIRVLNDRIKEAEQSTGDFRRNVGNYSDALSGLEQLSEGIEGVSKGSMGLAQGLLGVNALMGMFGEKTEEDAERAQQLQKMIALLSIAQQVNTNVLKSGIVQNKLAIVTDTIRTVQLKAKTAAEAASTKGTIAATVAQKVFNAVASANPYVILALVLLGVASALFAFASETGKAASAEEDHKKTLDDLTRSIDENDKALNRRVATLRAMGATELTVLNALKANASKAYDEAAAALNKYDASVREGNESVSSEHRRQLLDLMGQRKDALDQAEDDVKNYFNRVETRVRNSGKTELQLRKEKYEEDIKAAHGNREHLISLEKEYQLDVADIRKRSTDKAAEQRKAEREKLVKDLEDYFKSETQLLEEKFVKEYDLLEGNHQAQDRLTKRFLRDKKAIEDEAQREREAAQAKAQQGEEALQAKMTGDLKAAQAERKQVVDLSLEAVELSLAQALNRVGDSVKRDNKGLQLIDVEATKANLKAANEALDGYIDGLRKYQGQLTANHVMTLTTLKRGTPEYEAEVIRYAVAMEDSTKRINGALTEQQENLEMSRDAWTAYFADLFGKIGEIADGAATAVTSVTDTLNMGLQAQLDGLNEQMDALTERYEDARKLREDAVKHVEDIEGRLQAATGGTADALKEQLQDAMHARAEAEREEKRIAKEKEKLESDIVKKEKQMKRNDLIAKIAQGMANTALGITQALGSAPPPLNFVLAALVGTMGTIQTGIMAKQLAKLEKGGKIDGPSHANGGVPIRINGAPAYEAEGGEFMINKRSYGANANLVNFINDTPRTITAADLMGVVPGNTAPVVIADAGRASEDRVVEAINGINFKPVVSVTDINDVSDEVVTVKDLAGF